MAKKRNPRRLPITPPAQTSAELLLERKRRLLIRKTLTFMIVLILGGALLWNLYHWGTAAYWSAVIQRLQLVAEGFAVTVPVEGVILREEQLSIAPSGGSVIPLVYEATLVAPGDLVLTLDNSQSAETIAQQVYELEQKLVSYDSSQIAALQLLDQQILSDEAAVRQKTVQIRDAVQSFDRELIRQLDSDLRELNASRLKRIAERDQMPDDPQKLQDQIQELQQQLEQISIDVHAQDEGVLSYWIDGLEGSFTLWSFTNLSIDTLQNLPTANNLGSTREIKAGAPLFKTVDPGPWRWTGLIPVQDWQKWQEWKEETHSEDGLVSFYYDEVVSDGSDEGEKQEQRLESWLVDGPNLGDYQKITVEFPQLVASTLSRRMLPLRFVIREARGLVLKQENLLEYQGELGILIIEYGLVRFQRVEIADSDGDRVLVTSTMGPHEIVSNPSTQMIGVRLS